MLDKLPELKRAPEKDRYQGIRCPKCFWRPVASSRWFCGRMGPAKGQRCLCVWNTFDTRGKCPECSYQWKDTACLKCAKWSPHEDWYEKPPDEDA